MMMANSNAVIPGRAKREPGNLITTIESTRIPGLRLRSASRNDGVESMS